MTVRVQVRFQPGDGLSLVPAGTSLFAAAHWIDLPIDSTCGGVGTCGKCRVRVLSGGPEISAADRLHLSAEELENGWRLACQAVAMEDTTCEVSELLELPKTATAGSGREVAVEPGVHKVVVDLGEPSAHDTTGDLERLRQALGREGFEAEVDLDMLRGLPDPLRRSKFKVTAVLSDQHLVGVEPGDTRDVCFGVAFDVGTTTIVGSLMDLTSGEVLAVDSALNRQSVFGGDVISRIAYTMAGAQQRDEMRQAVIDTLNRILVRLFETAGVPRDRVYQALAVGNTTMLHLLLGVEARSISVAPFVPAFEQSMNVTAAEVGLGIHPRGRVETLPVIGAYVGADTVAGLHATNLARQEGLRLFIDIGTNSEIALGSRDGVLATSAPAGPAFEGSCIGAGMAATTGAIERVVLGDAVELGVVGGGKAQGICGSGLIDTVAQLLRAGLLDRTGKLKLRIEVDGHPLIDHLVENQEGRAFALTDGVRITQRDIRELQSAKSSVATGVQVLMERLGVGPQDLEEVLLAGSFGSAIDPVSASDIGLVPGVPLERIRFVGNVAAEGAKMALLSFREKQVAYDLASRVEYVELSLRPDFNDLFVAGLSFPELEAES